MFLNSWIVMVFSIFSLDEMIVIDLIWFDFVSFATTTATTATTTWGTSIIFKFLSNRSHCIFFFHFLSYLNEQSLNIRVLFSTGILEDCVQFFGIVFCVLVFNFFLFNQINFVAHYCNSYIGRTMFSQFLNPIL